MVDDGVLFGLFEPWGRVPAFDCRCRSRIERELRFEFRLDLFGAISSSPMLSHGLPHCPARPIAANDSPLDSAPARITPEKLHHRLEAREIPMAPSSAYPPLARAEHRSYPPRESGG